MYAVISTGGKQYKVTPNSKVQIEKLELEPGATVEFSEVLLVDDGKSVKIGSPTVAGAKVAGKVLEQGRGKKIRGFFFHPKKHWSRRFGHRQSLTTVQIESIKA